ncbi:MAG: hypothetical protein H6722_32890 [Sandaracinus sp.]|nr:hypothetical protein [Sandaracinus sp.]
MRILFALVVLLTGCPRDTTDPLRPDGDDCVTDDQCTPAGAPCGLVYACVDERCVEEPSRARPCEE